MLACDGCKQPGKRLDLVFKRGRSMHLCQACRKKNPCPSCGRMVSRMVLDPVRGQVCERCGRYKSPEA